MRTYELTIPKTKGKPEKHQINVQDTTTEDELRVKILSVLTDAIGVNIQQVDKSIIEPVKEAIFEVEQHIQECGLTQSVMGLVEGYEKQRDGYYVSHTTENAIKKKRAWLKLLSEHYHG